MSDESNADKAPAQAIAEEATDAANEGQPQAAGDTGEATESQSAQPSDEAESDEPSGGPVATDDEPAATGDEPVAGDDEAQPSTAEETPARDNAAQPEDGDAGDSTEADEAAAGPAEELDPGTDKNEVSTGAVE